MYMTRNVENCHILKLDDFLDDPNFGFSVAEKEDFVDAFFEKGSHYQSDGMWSVPMYKSTEIMYYNANMALENGCEPVRDSSFETDNYVYWTNKHSLDLKYDIPYTTSQLRENYIVPEHFIGSDEAYSQMGRLLNYILAEGRSVEEAFSSAYNICCAAAS